MLRRAASLGSCTPAHGMGDGGARLCQQDQAKCPNIMSPTSGYTVLLFKTNFTSLYFHSESYMVSCVERISEHFLEIKLDLTLLIRLHIKICSGFVLCSTTLGTAFKNSTFCVEQRDRRPSSPPRGPARPHRDCPVPPSEARPATSLLRIPVIGSIARGDQRLSCAMRDSIEPRIEQFSR